MVPFAPRHDNHHGGRVLAQLLASLVERHEVGIVHLDRGQEPPVDPALAARCAFVHAVSANQGRWVGARWRYRLNLLASRSTHLPTAVVAAHSWRLKRAVRRVAAEWRPDVIQLEGDVLAYCRQTRPRGPATLLVIHDPGLPSAQELASSTTGRQRFAHRLDARTWQRYWARMLPRMDAVVTLTRHDAEAVTAAVEGVTPTVIPLGIEIPAEPMNPVGSGEPSVIFVGGYSHTPNIDAAMRLMQSIIPQVRTVVPDLRLLIVGDDPPPSMRACAGRNDQVTGRVSTVTPYLDRAALVVLPIRLGGGMRVKLLEALAAGKAVVASPVAAAGVHSDEPGIIRIAESDEEFTVAITDLMADAEGRRALAQRARRWALENLSWSSRRTRYEEVYLDLVARTTAPTDRATRR